MGLLQITGFTENPRGVKIRYKLVQNENRPDDRMSEPLKPIPPEAAKDSTVARKASSGASSRS